MFNLLVTVLGVTLVAMLSIGSIFYGGAVFFTAKPRGNYVEVVNEYNRITSALASHRLEHGYQVFASAEEVVEEIKSQGYLTYEPLWTWRMTDDKKLVAILENRRSCEMMNRFAGYRLISGGEYCPPCDSEEFAEWPSCSMD